MLRLQTLERIASPKESSGYLKTLLNAWTTSARMATLAGFKGFDCCPYCTMGQDRIEHYARCPRIGETFARYGCKHGNHQNFLGLDFEYPDATLRKHAKLLCALFNSYHSALHNRDINAFTLFNNNARNLVG